VAEIEFFSIPLVSATCLALSYHCRRINVVAILSPLYGKLEVGVIMANLDWSQCPVVESVPGKVSGAWVLKGTRMPVSAIFENIEAGANIDDIMEWFDGLDREQVKALIEFAARSLDKAPVFTP
jgi:uncharacterized protein (DUF433 family)